jgi:hypothetical protein
VAREAAYLCGIIGSRQKSKSDAIDVVLHLADVRLRKWELLQLELNQEGTQESV